MNLTLFDLDGTLIATDSDHSFGDYLIQRGWVDADRFKAQNDAFYADYVAGNLDLPAYVRFATAAWRERPLADALAVREDFMRDVMRPQIQAQALDLVRRHQSAGDLVAIVTATNEFVTRPIADAFGIDHLLAVRLERSADGRYTGSIEGTPTFQAGKVVRVREWLRALGHSDQPSAYGKITVYSDSINDQALLDWATHPVATNPGASLEAYALERQWPILRLFS